MQLPLQTPVPCASEPESEWLRVACTPGFIHCIIDSIQGILH